MQNDFFGARSRVFIDVFSFLFAAFFLPGAHCAWSSPPPLELLSVITQSGEQARAGVQRARTARRSGRQPPGHPRGPWVGHRGRSPPGVSGQEHLLRAEAGPWTRRAGATRHTLVWTWSPELGRAHACIHLALGTPPGARPGKALGGTETWTLRLAPSPHGPGGQSGGHGHPEQASATEGCSNPGCRGLSRTGVYLASFLGGNLGRERTGPQPGALCLAPPWGLPGKLPLPAPPRVPSEPPEPLRCSAAAGSQLASSVFVISLLHFRSIHPHQLANRSGKPRSRPVPGDGERSALFVFINPPPSPWPGGEVLTPAAVGVRGAEGGRGAQGGRGAEGVCRLRRDPRRTNAAWPHLPRGPGGPDSEAGGGRQG